MKLSEELSWRGLIKDKTFEDIGWLDEPKAFYHGIDVSADSLTVGNLAPLLLARRLMEGGWNAVLLVGGATSLIGDPGGKVEERELMSREDVERNTKLIAGQVKRLFAGHSFTLVDNYEWFSKILFLDFLREYGKRFSMTELMQRDFVTARMGSQGSGISYAEFSYGLVQGYDFLTLNHKKKELGVVMQIGGSDQWSNMLMGVAMIRKKTGSEAHALSMPLVVNKETGVKFGKSEAGAVWLAPDKTSPTQFYQFWINADDRQTEEFLKIYTMMSKAEIERLISEQQKNPSERAAQRRLAQEVTELVHGREDTHAAEVVTNVLIGKTDIGKVSEGILGHLRKEIPSTKAKPGGSIIKAAAQTLSPSNAEAKRLLDNGGLYINSKVVRRETFEKDDFQHGRLLLRRGKAFKDSALVELP